MEGDIELDDIQVVDVTGKAYRDKKRRSKNNSCDCSPSLRMTTILIFVCIGIVYIIGVAIGIILMFDSLESLDMQSSNTSVNRLAMMIEGDMGKMMQFVLLHANSMNVYWALRNYTYWKEGKEHGGIAVTEENVNAAIDNFVIGDGVNTSANMMGGGPPYVFSCGAENNYYALLDADFNTIWSMFYGGDSEKLCYSDRPEPLPIIKPETYKQIQATDPDATGWMKLMVADDGNTKPMMIGLEQNNVDGERMYGYLVNGRCIFPRLVNGGSYADDVPTCITIENGKEDAKKWDKEDIEMFDKVTSGTIASDMTYDGLAVFAQRDNETVAATPGRMCPSVPLFNATSTLMVGYMKLCGLDPKSSDNPGCINIRVDRPMSMVSEGTTPVVLLSVEVIAMMVVLCIIFVIFLDCVVLRRIENLSNVIRSQTRGHAKALEEEDETTATMSVAEDKHTEKHGKSGKSSKTKAGRSASGTSETSDSSVTNISTASKGSAGAAGGAGTAHDEIGNLKRAMEQNAIGLRKRLEAVNDSIKIEAQKTVHHKQAMQLLNLWCGRKDFFPGLRPNAMQLRYEPTRNLDDLLGNPLAIEYLKSHCESDRTLENLWFLLDVSWLQELETAEDNEESPDKRAQIHDVVISAAKTIVQRYIALNAPQPINISSATFDKLRKVGEHYSRKMFDEAVSEVKLMLNTDILPRFQKTSAYSAMSETLYIDSSGGGDESSEFSDETVSTAGSILTDEGEGEGGVARIFAQTFKNLHTTFDVGHDDNSSSYSANSSRPTGSVVPDSQTETTTAHGDDRGTVQTSTKGDDDESEKEPPKLSDDEKEQEEEPKKEKENVESSESSNHSLSNDSMSESSSSSTAGISDASE